MKRRILLLCSAVAVIMTIVAISFKLQNKQDFLYEDKQKQEIAPDQNDTLLNDEQKPTLEVFGCEYSYVKYDEKRHHDSATAYIGDDFDILYADDDVMYGYYIKPETGSDYLFNNKGFLAEIVLTTDIIDSCDVNKYYIELVGKDFALDFNDKNSIKEFMDYTSVKPHFERTFYEHQYEVAYYDDNDTVCYYCSYDLYVDFPDKDMKYYNEIARWIADFLYESINYEQDINPLTSLYIGYNKHKVDSCNYKYDIIDIDSLSKFLADKYYEYVKKENENNVWYSVNTIMFLSHDFRAMIVKDNYVTYQMYTENYEGGAHGYYTEELVSFDPTTNKVIDWDYLFRPECKKDVDKAFLDYAVKDEKIIEVFDTTDNLFSVFAARDENDNIMDILNLPRPGLADEGICFSFQPYDISCYADGTFHIIVPYDKLEPYLTDRAKEVLGF